LRSFYNIFHPKILQRSLNGKNYFEGCYFKHVSAAVDDAIAAIIKKGTYALKATVSGVMKKITKKSLDSEVDLNGSKSRKTVFSGTCKYVGYEET
jgi:hypothetical protein